MTMKRVSRWLTYGMLTVTAAGMLLPFAWMMVASLKNSADFLNSLFLPRGEGVFGVAWDRLTLENFRRLFVEAGLVRPLVNSVFLSSLTAVLATLCCALAGYALSKLEFAGRRIVTAIVLAALVIPAPLLLAPGFKLLFQLNLLDTYAGLILPAAAPALGVFLFRQATLNAVPRELIEAARIDGAGEFRIFFEIVLPSLRPVVGAFLLISFLGMWNNFIQPQVVLQQVERHPLSVAVNSFKGLYLTEYGMIMSGTAVSILPVMGLFLLLQREFIAGLTSGAVKG